MAAGNVSMMLSCQADKGLPPHAAARALVAAAWLQADKYRVAAHLFDLIPGDYDILLMTEKAKCARLTRYDKCRQPAVLHIEHDVAHAAQAAPVPDIYNVLIAQFTDCALHMRASLAADWRLCFSNNTNLSTEYALRLRYIS